MLTAETTSDELIVFDKNRYQDFFIKFLLFLALYINLGKIFTGNRFFSLISDVLLFITAVRFILIAISQKKKFYFVEKITLTFLFICCLALFHPNLPSIVVGIEGFRRIAFQMLGVFIGINLSLTNERFHSINRFMVIISIPILLYGIKQFFFIDDFDLRIINSNTADVGSITIFGKIRSFGIFNGPFHLGLFGGVIFWICIGAWRSYKSGWYFVAGLISFISVLSTLTRASIVAIIVSLVLFSKAISKKEIPKIIFFVALFSIVGFTVYQTYSEELDYLGQTFETFQSVESIQSDGRFGGRFWEYEIALESISKNPFGTGIGSAGDAMEYYFEPYGRFHVTSHNLFLRILIETGWFGLLVYFSLFYYLIAKSWKLLKKDKEYGVIFAGILFIIMITGITGSTIEAYPINLIFWIYMGILCRFPLTNLIKNGNENKFL